MKSRHLSKTEQVALLDTLKERFAKNPHRHQGIEWETVLARLEDHPAKLRSLHLMEETDGQPDAVGCDPETGEILFFDCSPESPKGRTSLCYDPQALESRKQHKPRDSAMGMASAMGVEILTEEQYYQLQTLGEFDLKTSSWLKTPDDIRKLGGAIFGDRRFGRTFIYHNGAESYYAARGFRGCLRV